MATYEEVCIARWQRPPGGGYSRRRSGALRGEIPPRPSTGRVRLIEPRWSRRNQRHDRIAHPGQVPDVLDEVLKRIAIDRIALHFHDTRGSALANVLMALEMGVETFDASAGGLGGCPYAPGAAGNLATDDLIYMLNGLGIETGVSLPALSEATAFIADRVGHPLPSRYAQAARPRGAP